MPGFKYAQDVDITSDRLYAHRHWVLFLFTALTLSQAMTWFTFSAVSSDTQTYYGIDAHTIDVFTMWG